MVFPFLFVFFSVLPNWIESSCWGTDPNFLSDLTIQELSSEKLRVKWNPEVINDLRCVDIFFVHCWKTGTESRSNGYIIQLNKNMFMVK